MSNDQPRQSGNPRDPSPRRDTGYLASLDRVYDRSGEYESGSAFPLVELSDILAPDLVPTGLGEGVPQGFTRVRNYSGTATFDDHTEGPGAIGAQPDGTRPPVYPAGRASWMTEGTRYSRVEEIRGVPLPRTVPGRTYALDGFVVPGSKVD